MLLTTLTILAVSAAPPAETYRAASEQFRKSFERDVKACTKRHADRALAEKCVEESGVHALATYLATIRAGGEAMKGALARERRELDVRDSLLELAEAALDPAEVASRLRSTPQEEERHALRVTTLLQTDGLAAWEAELRAVRPEWLRPDLGLIAREEKNAEQATALFERVAGNQFLPDDVRVTARTLAALRGAKLAVTTRDEMILRSCAKPESSLALLRPASSCAPSADERSRCLEATGLAGRALPKGAFTAEFRPRDEGVQLACLWHGKSTLTVTDARVVTDEERATLEHAFDAKKP